MHMEYIYSSGMMSLTPKGKYWVFFVSLRGILHYVELHRPLYCVSLSGMFILLLNASAKVPGTHAQKHHAKVVHRIDTFACVALVLEKLTPFSKISRPQPKTLNSYGVFMKNIHQ